MVHVVRVRDPQDGNDVVDTAFPPRPAGSPPILAIPTAVITAHGQHSYIYIRQSNAIMGYLEEPCNSGELEFSAPNGSLLGEDALACARISEVMSLAGECTIACNPVRIFGTNAGTMSIPDASNEMLRWVRRSLMGIERFFEGRDMSLLRRGSY